MARPSNNIDRRMLEVAKEIVCERGCTGIRVREIAARADANLGMFHYHFKNKRRFTRVLLQEYYDTFFSLLTNATQNRGPAIKQLRNVLLAAALYVKQEHRFYSALLKDILSENEEVLKFVRDNFPRHAGLLRELISQSQAEGAIAPLPFSQIISFLMTSLNFPTVIALTIQDRHPRVRVSNEFGIHHVISDAAIAQRLDMALKGVAP